MTNATLTQLLDSVLGTGKIIGFFLVLARVGPLFVLAPLFSSKMLVRQVRVIVAVALSIGLTGIATQGQRISSAPLVVAALLAKEMAVGLGFSLIVASVIWGLEMAGSLTDAAAGFSFGSMIDPINGNQGGVITQFYGQVGLITFIAIGGDAWMLRGLARTFVLVPLTRMPQINSLVAGCVQAFGSVYIAGIEVAAPALLAILITDVAFGMVSRAMPQLNVFAVGFSLKIGIALLVVAATMPFFGSWLTSQITTSVGTALQALRIG